jgi:hypothetical protein
MEKQISTGEIPVVVPLEERMQEQNREIKQG